MPRQAALTSYTALYLGGSALVGFIIKTFLSVYLWEELTHSGDYYIMGRTSAQVARATLSAVALCGFLALALAIAQFFATLPIAHRYQIAKPKRFAAILAFANWLLLFLPAAISAYLFNPVFWRLL